MEKITFYASSVETAALDLGVNEDGEIQADVWVSRLGGDLNLEFSLSLEDAVKLRDWLDRQIGK